MFDTVKVRKNHLFLIRNLLKGLKMKPILDGHRFVNMDFN